MNTTTNTTTNDNPEFIINYNLFIMILTMCNFVYGFGSAIWKVIQNSKIKTQSG